MRIKAHDWKKQVIKQSEWQERFLLFHHCLSTDISPFVVRSLKSAETTRIPLLVCSCSGHPQGGSNLM